MLILYLAIVSIIHSECLEEGNNGKELLPEPVIGAFFEDNGSMRKAFSLAVNTVNKCLYDHKFCEKIHPTDPKINKHLFHQVRFSTIIALHDGDIYSVRENFAKIAGVNHKEDLSSIKNANGLSFLIGPNKSIASLYVQGLCELYNLPHVVIRRETENEHSSTQTINLYPDTETLYNVFLDLVTTLKWTTFTILYEDTNNFIDLHKILTMYPDYEDSVYGIKLTSYNSNYSEPLLKAKKVKYKNFLIDCRFDILNDVLTQIQEVGMMTEDYTYILTALDLHAIDWRQYQYSNVTIHGFQLMDLSNPFIHNFIKDYLKIFQIETVEQFRLKDALVFDAVMMFSQAYKEFNYRNGPLYSARFYKDFEKEFYPWKEGLSLRNFMLYTEIKGLSGLVAIDGDGARRRFKLDLMNLYQTGLKKLAEWNFENGFVNYKYQKPKRKPHYKVLITNNPPYATKVNHSRMMSGNDRYEGLVVDIMKELAKDLDFTYTLILHPNTNNGVCRSNKIGKDNETVCLSCDGVTGEVLYGHVDMAITDLTMTENRAKCVQFSTPFMNLGISLLMKKPQNVITLFSFLAPFSTWLWVCIMLSTIGISTLFFILGRLCPAEWTNPYPCIEEPDELQNQFTFNNAVWFVTGALLQQGSEIAPIGLSTRVLACHWYFFCLILTNSYTANLFGALFDQTPERLIYDYNDLLKYPEIKIGAKAHGSTVTYFKNSNNQIQQQLYKRITDTDCNNCLVEENDDGVKNARSNDTKYAFLMESSTIQYVIRQYCELEQVGNLIDQKSYAIAYLKNFTVHQKINEALSRMEESSKLAQLRNKWWNEKGNQCGVPESDDAKSMTEEQLRGVFVVLGAGLVISSIITTYASCRGIKSIARAEELNFFETAKIEMKNMTRSKPIKPVLSKQKSIETNPTDRSFDRTMSTRV